MGIMKRLPLGLRKEDYAKLSIIRLGQNRYRSGKTTIPFNLLLIEANFFVQVNILKFTVQYCR